MVITEKIHMNCEHDDLMKNLQQKKLESFFIIFHKKEVFSRIESQENQMMMEKSILVSQQYKNESNPPEQEHSENIATTS